MERIAFGRDLEERLHVFNNVAYAIHGLVCYRFPSDLTL